jgi:hypothetical protein
MSDYKNGFGVIICIKSRTTHPYDYEKQISTWKLLKVKELNTF